MSGAWTFALNRDSALVNSMNEGESFDISLNFTANDGTQETPGLSSDEATLTIHIQGANDRPVFTAVTAGSERFDVTAHGLSSAGDLVATDGPDVEGVSSTISGSLRAVDADADNGAGSETQSGNQLTFMLTGFAGSVAGTVSEAADGTVSYQPYDESSSQWSNLVSASGTLTGPETDADGREYCSMTTSYGTFRVYEDGSYTYTATSTDQLGGDEYVTETFTVRVQDAHGSFSEQTITITLRDEESPIRGGAQISQSLREEGVETDGSDPNSYVATEQGIPTNSSGENTSTLFSDADINDTITLRLAQSSIALTKANASADAPDYWLVPEINNIPLGAAGSSTTLYLVTGNNKFSWSYTPGTDTVGRLVFTRQNNGDVDYTFTLDPLNETQNSTDHSDNSAFLDRLAEGDKVQVTFYVNASNSGSDNISNSEIFITILGTNDRPGIHSTVTDAHLTVESDGSSGSSDIPDVAGRVTASDVDRDNGEGSTENNGLHLSWSGMQSETIGGCEPSSILSETSSGDSLTIKTTYGTLILNLSTGEFTYTMDEPSDATGTPNAIMRLNAQQQVTETFSISVTDSHGATATQEITITIQGSDDTGTASLTISPDMNPADTGGTDVAVALMAAADRADISFLPADAAPDDGEGLGPIASLGDAFPLHADGAFLFTDTGEALSHTTADGTPLLTPEGGGLEPAASVRLSGGEENTLHGNAGADMPGGDGGASGVAADTPGLHGDGVTADHLHEALPAPGDTLKHFLSAVEGTEGSGTLHGEGNDMLFGTGGSDAPFGGAGSDDLHGGAGQDGAVGGSDMVVYDASGSFLHGGTGLNLFPDDPDAPGTDSMDDLLSGLGGTEDGGPGDGFDTGITGSGLDHGLTSPDSPGTGAEQAPLADWHAGGEGFTPGVDVADLTQNPGFTPEPYADASVDDAVQTQVFLLQNNQGA